MTENPIGMLGAPPGRVDSVLRWYESQPWLRAAIQAVPGVGGSLDTLVAWRGSVLAQNRFDELIANISARLEYVESNERRQALLRSEEFIEVLRSCVDAVARSASADKRRRVADFLAGTIQAGQLEDLSQQIADDLVTLRDLHMRVLAILPDEAGFAVSESVAGANDTSLTVTAYGKAISDLVRLGFIVLNTSSVGYYGGGAPELETTEYLAEFKRAIRGVTNE